jgi:nucleotide-binding universal stress UspA family protein
MVKESRNSGQISQDSIGLERRHTMQGFKNILFPVDFSTASAKVAPYVKEIAEKFQSEVHIVFVARVFDYFESIYVPHPSITNFQTEVVKGGVKKLEEFTETLFQGTPCKTQVLSGDAAEEILKYSEKHGIDLIIMGTHGRKGLERTIFGSVAERVVKKSLVPVLTVNPFRKAK